MAELSRQLWGWWLSGFAAVVIGGLSAAAFVAAGGLAWVLLNAPVAATLNGWSLDDAVSLWARLWWGWGPFAAAFAVHNLRRPEMARLAK